MKTLQNYIKESILDDIDTQIKNGANAIKDEIKAFLAGNLCRCSGYDGQLRGIRAYLDSIKK